MESMGTRRQRSYNKQARFNYEKQKEKTCTVIDIAIPADRNVMQKEAGKKINTIVCV